MSKTLIAFTAFAFKRFLIPFLTGMISSIIPSVLGFKIDSWQYWWVSLPIIFMSWIIYPLHQEIMGKRS